MAITDRPRLFGLAIGEGFRRFKRRLRTRSIGLIRFNTSAPERILLSPQDLRTTDPTRAQEFYQGQYFFADKWMDAKDGNPFSQAPPSEQWMRELHAFRWFRHLSISESPLAREHGRKLLTDWFEQHPAPTQTAVWDIEITSKRLISWLMHSFFVLEGAEHQFHRDYMRSLGEHIRYLKRMSGDAPYGLPRLYVHLALAYARVCISGQRNNLRNAFFGLQTELNKQIFADGGHVSRNPSVLPQLLADLVPLQQAMMKQEEGVPPELTAAINRMMPALRFFSHADGNLARFNGTSVTEHDLVATLFRYDTLSHAVPEDATQSGFQRLIEDGTIVIMDSGKPPSGTVSGTAHAGTLSFELSSGSHSVIVNCGVPPIVGDDKRPWRATAAHSTVTLNNTSSSRFETGGSLNKYIGEQLVSAPGSVTSMRESNGAITTISGSHDGYLRTFGVIHHRTMKMMDRGRIIEGNDQFLDRKGNPATYQSRDDAVIRFHLHPSVVATAGERPGTVFISARGQPLWQFNCVDAPVTIEDSIFFAMSAGATRSQQIVIRAVFSSKHDIRWMLQKVN